MNPAGGGPILADKLWFFGSARWQANKSYIAGLYPNLNAGDPNAWLYAPDTSGRVSDSVTQQNGSVRLTWQADAKNKVGLYFEKQGRDWLNARAGTSAESSIHYVFPTSRMATLGWSSPMTSRLLLEGRYSYHAEVYYQPVPEDVFGSLIPVTEQSTGLIYRGISVGPTPFVISSAPNIHQAVASLSYVTGAHAIKVGFSDLWGQQANGARDNSSSLSYRFNNGVPNLITERSTPYDNYNQLHAELGIYAQDKWTIKRLTLNGGLRFDYFSTYFPAQTLGPGTLVPNRNLSFPETPWYGYKDVNPRIGAVYDLRGDGKTAIKASLGRFVLASNPTTGNPVLNLATSVTRTWTDANRNFVPDCDLLNPLANGGECGAISDSTFGGLRPSTSYDPATLSGWRARPADWEFSTSVQRQLAPRVGIDVGYYRRWYTNQAVTQNLAVAATDFSSFSVTAPLDSRLPGGGGYVLGGLYNLNPNKVGAVNNYITFADNFGGLIEHWNGFDATVNLRLPSAHCRAGRTQRRADQDRQLRDCHQLSRRDYRRVTNRRRAEHRDVPPADAVPDAGQAARHLHGAEGGRPGGGHLPELPGTADCRQLRRDQRAGAAVARTSAVWRRGQRDGQPDRTGHAVRGQDQRARSAAEQAAEGRPGANEREHRSRQRAQY